MFTASKIYHLVLHICKVYARIILNVFCCDLLYSFSIIILGFLDVMSCKSSVFMATYYSTVEYTTIICTVCW